MNHPLCSHTQCKRWGGEQPQACNKNVFQMHHLMKEVYLTGIKDSIYCVNAYGNINRCFQLGFLTLSCQHIGYSLHVSDASIKHSFKHKFCLYNSVGIRCSNIRYYKQYHWHKQIAVSMHLWKLYLQMLQVNVLYKFFTTLWNKLFFLNCYFGK